MFCTGSSNGLVGKNVSFFEYDTHVSKLIIEIPKLLTDLYLPLLKMNLFLCSHLVHDTACLTGSTNFLPVLTDINLAFVQYNYIWPLSFVILIFTRTQ